MKLLLWSMSMEIFPLIYARNPSQKLVILLIYANYFVDPPCNILLLFQQIDFHAFSLFFIVTRWKF